MKWGYATQDKALRPLIEEIAGHLHEIHLREKFAIDIRSLWTVIVETPFVNDETLMVYINPDADLMSLLIV